MTRVEINVGYSIRIDWFAELLIRESIKINDIVCAEFNSVDMIALPNSDVKTVIRNWEDDYNEKYYNKPKQQQSIANPVVQKNKRQIFIIGE